ncbi:hypothetical protein MLD38_040114 [Melastoma candidum]|uniref:Uncharacterized protein n=1 Tax=Melastoma candidum TaxID=119954 RepID=A0ACB9L5N8_9MYRT|nr:hypothetical protein MLD38_040114 [Melastoma candidum]
MFLDPLFSRSTNNVSTGKFEVSDIPVDFCWNPSMFGQRRHTSPPRSTVEPSSSSSSSRDAPNLRPSVSTTSGNSVMDLLRARMLKPSLVSPAHVASLKDDDKNFHSHGGGPFPQDALKYISQTLMEENSEKGFITNFDPSALLATENELQSVLEKKCPASPLYTPISFGQRVARPGSHPSGNVAYLDGIQENFFSGLSGTCFVNDMDELAAVVRPLSASKQSNAFSDLAGQSIGRANKSYDQQMSAGRMPGLRQLIGLEGPGINLSGTINTASEVDECNHGKELRMGLKPTNFRNQEQVSVVNLHHQKKNHEREEGRLQEGRNSKQPTGSGYLDVDKLSEAFDRILLCDDHHPPGHDSSHGKENMTGKSSAPPKQTQGTNARGGCPKKGRSREGIVDLRNLLMLCAQATSVSDLKDANELLKQIRLHSSPMGDGSQRMAHYLANALEARLAGNAVPNIFTSLMAKNTKACQNFKTCQVYFSACPFVKIGFSYANNMILNAAKGAKVLHIIDYGILFGFQWPSLIQLLSIRPGGPPKLRITGIELPQQGFKPAERLWETGQNLEWYCQRFGVPFEFNAVVSSKWETIKLEELKLASDEVVAVNSIYRFSSLLDETLVENNPRDAVLKFLREIQPNLFVLSVINGAFNSPFFVARFREAMFHFSALFDMMDENVPRDSEERMTIEREFFGREAMNVISCEGLERVERPETYKQWQARITQAGFQRVPLDKSLIEIFRATLKSKSHKDFHIDEDNRWMLQGWKGRIMYATSSWITN